MAHALYLTVTLNTLIVVDSCRLLAQISAVNNAMCNLALKAWRCREFRWRAAYAASDDGRRVFKERRSPGCTKLFWLLLKLPGLLSCQAETSITAGVEVPTTSSHWTDGLDHQRVTSSKGVSSHHLLPPSILRDEPQCHPDSGAGCIDGQATLNHRTVCYDEAAQHSAPLCSKSIIIAFPAREVFRSTWQCLEDPAAAANALTSRFLDIRCAN